MRTLCLEQSFNPMKCFEWLVFSSADGFLQLQLLFHHQLGNTMVLKFPRPKKLVHYLHIQLDSCSQDTSKMPPECHVMVSVQFFFFLFKYHSL